MKTRLLAINDASVAFFCVNCAKYCFFLRVTCWVEAYALGAIAGIVILDVNAVPATRASFPFVTALNAIPVRASSRRGRECLRRRRRRVRRRGWRGQELREP